MKQIFVLYGEKGSKGEQNWSLGASLARVLMVREDEELDFVVARGDKCCVQLTRLRRNLQDYFGDLVGRTNGPKRPLNGTSFYSIKQPQCL